MIPFIPFSWAQPYFQYCSTSTGHLIRKTKDHITVESILEKFQPEESSPQKKIADHYNKWQNQEEQVVASYIVAKKGEKDGQIIEEVEFEYF